MLKKRNQKGFTLIEIIAVLIILGILAAVAIPRYFSMQDEARNAAIQGAIAAAASNLNLGYAKFLLTGGSNASLTAGTGTITGSGGTTQTLPTDVGDFVANYTAAGPTAATTTISILQKTDGANWVTDYTGSKSKDVSTPWAP